MVANTTTIVQNVSSTSWSSDLNNLTISNLVHHTIQWKRVLNTIPTLTIKLYLGSIITIISVVLFLHVLFQIEQSYTYQRESDWIESNVGTDTELTLVDENDNSPNDNDNNNNNNNNTTKNGNNNKDGIVLAEMIRPNIETSMIKEQDDHATPPQLRRKTNFDGIVLPSNKKYRKLLPSQKIIISIQVLVLTIFNYLFLVFIPDQTGILPFIGMACIWILTLRTVIQTELGINDDLSIRQRRKVYQSQNDSYTGQRRLDRIVALISLFLFIAGGLSYITYCQTALLEGEVYDGSARIVGYDSRSYNNSNGRTIRSNLQVSWGGKWGCPNSPSGTYCTADVNGALCQTQYKNNTKKGNKKKQKQQQQQQDQAGNNTSNDTADTEVVATPEVAMDDAYYEDQYYDVYWEAQVDTVNEDGIVLYKDKNEEVDMKYTDDYVEHDKEEVIVKYSNGEKVDVTKQTSSSIVNVTTTTNTTTTVPNSNGTKITTVINDEEEDFTLNGTVTKHISNTTVSKNNTNTNGNNNNNRRTTTSKNSSENTTTSKQVQKDVDASVQQEETKVNEEEVDYVSTVLDEEATSEVEDAIYYANATMTDEEKIAQLQLQNKEYQTANDNLKQQINDLQAKINATELQDKTLIGDEITLTDQIEEDKVQAADKEIENGTAPQGYGATDNDDVYDTVFTDDYWNNNEWDNVWGQYACEDLFDQSNNEYGTYDPSLPPGYTNSTYHDKWPTIEIYGNCRTCSAYLIDYYTTEHYEQAAQYREWSHWYFTIASIVGIFAIVCHLYFKHVHHNGPRTSVDHDLRQADLLSSIGSLSMHGRKIGSSRSSRSTGTSTGGVSVLA